MCVLTCAYVAGHGTMEFAPSRHSFIVNGKPYNVTFLEPLDQWGCSKHVSVGEPFVGRRAPASFHANADPVPPFRFAKASSPTPTVHGGLAETVRP